MKKFYCDIPTGWKFIVYNAIAKLVNLNIEITQVKIKFGDLRIYMRDPGTTGLMHKAMTIIDDTRLTAQQTCAFCGSASDEVSGFDYQPICFNCAEGRNAEEN